MPRFKKNTEAIEDVKEKVKRGERILFSIRNNLFQKVASNLKGFLCAGFVAKRSASNWVAFGCCNENGTVKELENLSFRSSDPRSAQRLSVAHLFASSCSDIITISIKKNVCKKAGNWIEVVKYHLVFPLNIYFHQNSHFSCMSWVIKVPD
jgi:hypothetical protein